MFDIKIHWFKVTWVEKMRPTYGSDCTVASDGHYRALSIKTDIDMPDISYRRGRYFFGGALISYRISDIFSINIADIKYRFLNIGGIIDLCFSIFRNR